MTNALTIAITISTKDENLGNLQRLFKKAILDLLEEAFPAGNSLTLLKSRALLDGDVFRYIYY